MSEKYCHNCCKTFRDSYDCPHCDSEHWDYTEHLIDDANREMFEDDFPYDDIGSK